MGILCENTPAGPTPKTIARAVFGRIVSAVANAPDASAILLCGIYVDLNPYRAGEAESPEKASYTSLFSSVCKPRACARRRRSARSAWLGELTLPPERKSRRGLGLRLAVRTPRASDQGILPISLADYVKLLQWTAQQLRSGQRSTIPHRLGGRVGPPGHLKHNTWLETVKRSEESFGHAVGRPASLVAVAQRMELKHLKGMSACRSAFT